MKKIIFFSLLSILLFCSLAIAMMQGKEAHEKYLYPIVRVTTENNGGSGTIVYSRPEEGKISTYILTNYHVIADIIKIEEKWEPSLGKNVKVERRGIVYVEIFKYHYLGIPVGTMRIESDLIIYNDLHDLAVLKLRLTEQIPHVAILPKKEEANNYNLFDKTIAVGCSLLFPPLATPGIISRKNYQIDSLPYHMSTSQIIYGNSGGAMFLAKSGALIGIPSQIPVIGWGITPITHMGLFIPIDRIYQWLEKENYDFIYDSTKTEKKSLELRKERINKEKEKNN